MHQPPRYRARAVTDQLAMGISFRGELLRCLINCSFGMNDTRVNPAPSILSNLGLLLYCLIDGRIAVDDVGDKIGRLEFGDLEVGRPSCGTRDQKLAS